MTAEQGNARTPGIHEGSVLPELVPGSHKPTKSKLRIAVFGAGCIGSMFAWHLVRHGGHEVTVVARGARLAELQADNAILDVAGNRAEVIVSAMLDPAIPYDLLLVPVKANQVAELLPTLQASSAKTIMFNSVTFSPLASMRNAVGSARFAYGFPKFPAFMEGGKLKNTKISSSTPIVVTEVCWVEMFNDVRIPCRLVPCDMDSYMRAHVAATTPLLTLCFIAHKRGAGIFWSEARKHAQAQGEGFAIVKQLGLSIPQAGLNWMSKTPQVFNAFIFWLASRALPADFKELLYSSAGEAAFNIDEMSSVAPSKVVALLEIRPH